MEIALLILSVCLLLALGYVVFLLKKQKTQPVDYEKIRDILTKNLLDFGPNIASAIDEKNKSYAESTKMRLDDFTKSTGEKLDLIGKSLNEKVAKIQTTVDEQLRKTLEDNLKSSFDKLIAQMTSVTTSIGEIKGLASEVGNLKGVLTGVKTKGIVGEVILGNLLSEILTKEQYSENVVTKKNSRDPVEFAVKMPGKEGDFIYLPIDSKFPLEPYSVLKNAIELGDKEQVENARKELKKNVLTFAKDISTKYIDAVQTTDFALMFLPTEGLYIECMENGSFEEAQRKFKVNIVGPSTLSALLNALQMGFKTLAIQKKSAEVFDILRSTEDEFSKFAEALNKAQGHINQASQDLTDLMTTRTNKLQAQFKKLASFSKDNFIEE